MPIFEVECKLGDKVMVGKLKARSEKHAREKMSEKFKLIWNEEKQTFEIARFETLSIKKES